MMARDESKSKSRFWRWTLVLIAASPSVLWLWQREATPTEIDVETARVTLGDLERTVVATGVIRPRVGAEVDVGSRISGRVVDLPAQVGDAVEAGDLLARLDATGLDARIAQAKADCAVVRAELAQAETAFERRRRLADQGISTLADLEASRRDLEVAKARVASAQAGLRAAEIERGYARIEAPIRGVIAAITTREGETVAASLAAPTFVTIIDLDRLEVQAYVDETDIGRVFVGQSATFGVDTYPELELAARVAAIQPKAELRGSVVNYVVILVFDPHPEAVLRPEMTAHIRLLLERRRGVLTVPRAALRRRDGRRYVRVRRGEEWLEQRIEIGWRDDGMAEVLKGLALGEIVQINPV